MEPIEYEKMFALESTYWWFQGRKKIITACLEAHGLLRPGAQVLDVGCGTGLMLQSLAQYQPVGLDFSHLAMDFCRKRGIDRLVQADVIQLPFHDASFDLILALDMLEHVERDDLLVQQFFRVLRPGGCAVITVPAHQWLWSEHDEALHHYRRYSDVQLRRLLEEGGFHLEKFSFAISTTYAPIVAFRRLQRWLKRKKSANNHTPKTHLIVLPGLVNKALIKLLEVEAWWLRRHSLPQGVTLLCLARRP